MKNRYIGTYWKNSVFNMDLFFLWVYNKRGVGEKGVEFLTQMTSINKHTEKPHI